MHEAKRGHTSGVQKSDRVADGLLRSRALKHPMADIIQKVGEERKKARYTFKRKGDAFFDKRWPRSFMPELTALVKLYGKDLHGLKDKTIIVLAGGHGELASFLNANFGTKAVSLDLDTENIKIGLSTGLHGGVVGRADKLPFKDASVDIVISSHFIFSGYGSIPSIEGSIFRETARVLKNEGQLVLTRTYNMNMEDALRDSHIRGWKVAWEDELSGVPLLPGEGQNSEYVKSSILVRSKPGR